MCLDSIPDYTLSSQIICKWKSLQQNMGIGVKMNLKKSTSNQLQCLSCRVNLMHDQNQLEDSLPTWNESRNLSSTNSLMMYRLHRCTTSQSALSNDCVGLTSLRVNSDEQRLWTSSKQMSRTIFWRFKWFNLPLIIYMGIKSPSKPFEICWSHFFSKENQSSLKS